MTFLTVVLGMSKNYVDGFHFMCTKLDVQMVSATHSLQYFSFYVRHMRSVDHKCSEECWPKIDMFSDFWLTCFITQCEPLSVKCMDLRRRLLNPIHILHVSLWNLYVCGAFDTPTHYSTNVHVGWEISCYESSMSLCLCFVLGFFSQKLWRQQSTFSHVCYTLLAKIFNGKIFLVCSIYIFMIYLYNIINQVIIKI